MPTAHLLHGFIGSGKTTFARELERSSGAVRFTYDEWMHHLYGDNLPKEQFINMYNRIDDLIWQYAIMLLKRNVDVIIDSGFWSRSSRDLARQRVADAGGQAILYRITCPEAMMRARVAARTTNLPDDSLWINEAAFDELKGRFEELDEDEAFISVDTSIE